MKEFEINYKNGNPSTTFKANSVEYHDGKYYVSGQTWFIINGDAVESIKEIITVRGIDFDIKELEKVTEQIGRFGYSGADTERLFSRRESILNHMHERLLYLDRELLDGKEVVRNLQERHDIIDALCEAGDIKWLRNYEGYEVEDDE